MSLSGSLRREAWKQLAEELHITYIEGRYFRSPRLEYQHNSWTISLDTYTVSTGKSHITYTRMRAPFLNPKKFLFKIYKKGVFSNIGKAFGMQDIEIGYDYFDTDYIIKGNDEQILRKVFQNHELRDLIEKQKKIFLEIKNNEGRFGPKFNENESELYFICIGVITDKERLKNLFELFKKILNEFEISGITIHQTPGVQLYKE